MWTPFWIVWSQKKLPTVRTHFTVQYSHPLHTTQNNRFLESNIFVNFYDVHGFYLVLLHHNWSNPLETNQKYFRLYPKEPKLNLFRLFFGLFPQPKNKFFRLFRFVSVFRSCITNRYKPNSFETNRKTNKIFADCRPRYSMGWALVGRHVQVQHKALL